MASCASGFQRLLTDEALCSGVRGSEPLAAVSLPWNCSLKTLKADLGVDDRVPECLQAVVKARFEYSDVEPGHPPRQDALCRGSVENWQACHLTSNVTTIRHGFIRFCAKIAQNFDLPWVWTIDSGGHA